MDLNQAASKHSEWKIKLRTAISTHESLDAATIAKDDCCELGKWLHGEAKAKYATLPSYKKCVCAHAAFHTEAGKIAQTINAKKFPEAEAMLKAGTGYTTASTTVGVAILDLQKEMGAAKTAA